MLARSRTLSDDMDLPTALARRDGVRVHRVWRTGWPAVADIDKHLHAPLHLVAPGGHGLHHHPDAGAPVARQGAVAVGHQDVLHAMGEQGADLADVGPAAAGHLVGAAEQLHLARGVDLVGRHLDALRRGGPLAEVEDRAALAAPARGGGRGLGGAEQAGLGDVVGVCEGRGQAADHPDAGALLRASLDALDPAVLHRHGRGVPLLHEAVGEVPPALQGSLEGGGRGLSEAGSPRRGWRGRERLRTQDLVPEHLGAALGRSPLDLEAGGHGPQEHLHRGLLASSYSNAWVVARGRIGRRVWARRVMGAYRTLVRFTSPSPPLAGAASRVRTVHAGPRQFLSASPALALRLEEVRWGRSS